MTLSARPGLSEAQPDIMTEFSEVLQVRKVGQWAAPDANLVPVEIQDGFSSCEF